MGRRFLPWSALRAAATNRPSPPRRPRHQFARTRPSRHWPRYVGRRPGLRNAARAASPMDQARASGTGPGETQADDLRFGATRTDGAQRPDALSEQRLDKFLWCARFASQRTACAGMAASGLVRINRQPTDKPHARVRPGDVLTLPLHRGVRVIRVLALSGRRGSARDAQALFVDVDEGDGLASKASPESIQRTRAP